MRRAAAIACVAAVVALLALGCARKEAGEQASPAPGAAGEQAGKQLEIAVVPKGTAHVFWLSVKAGAEKAAEEFGAKILWNGPADEREIEQQKRIIEDFIERGIDALVFAACDADALITVAQKAKDEGVVVVTIDSGINNDEIPVSFVATDNVEGGRIAARKLAELIGERGKVGLIPFLKGAESSDQREKGFREEIAKYPNIELCSVLYCQSDTETARKVTEDMLTAHPDLAGIFAANEPGGVGAAAAIEQRGLAGKVKLVAFDASKTEVDALERGTIQALIVQNPFKMGYEGVKAAIDTINGKSVQKRIDTGVTVVTKENLDKPEIQDLIYPVG